MRATGTARAGQEKDMQKIPIGVIEGKGYLGDGDFAVWDCYADSESLYNDKLHFHDFCEMSFFYEGEGRYFVNGRECEISPGFVLLSSPSDYHMLSADGGAYLRYYNVIFRTGILSKTLADAIYSEESSLFSLLSGGNLYSIKKDFEQLASRFSIYESSNGRTKELDRLFVKNLIENLCISVLRSVHENKPQDSREYSGDEIIRKALLYIRENYREKITLAKTAQAVGLSQGYFSSYFNRVMQIGFPEYVMKYRLIIAAGYIASADTLSKGLSLKEIAYMNGFSSFTYFSNAFSEYFGVSPREYRNRTHSAEG